MSELRTVDRQASAARVVAARFAELAGFAALLFVARFVARGHLIPQMDQECHIGGIAADLLAHGVRFPLLVYAPNEYDNGSFFSGVLAAASFSLLGRSVLALKLVTHLISAAGAVAALSLLRGCLRELGVAGRRARWAAAAALVIGFASAPRIVTLTATNAVGNHAEGAAIDAILMALFSLRLHSRSAARTAAFWAVVGFALYLNKGTLLVIPVFAAFEIAIARRPLARLLAASGGFVVGVGPELAVIVQRHGMGWNIMAGKAERSAPSFPWAFFDTVLTLGEHRVELLALWAVAIGAGIFLLVRSAGRAHRGSGSFPVTLGVVIAVACLHLAALSIMAAGGLDAYAVYAHAPMVVLTGLLVAVITARGEGAGPWTAVAAVALVILAYRPDAVTGGPPTVSELWGNRPGAACSWRLAEGFEREHDYRLVPSGRTREQHAIERCRSLSEPDQVLDCIGGIARELNWRARGKVDGGPPAELSALEGRAYAYYYGTHRFGDAIPCREFTDPALAADCAAAVQLECLVFGDVVTRFLTGQAIGRPGCPIGEPPMDGYWAAMRSRLLERSGSGRPTEEPVSEDTDLRGCEAVFDACY